MARALLVLIRLPVLDPAPVIRLRQGQAGL